MGASSGRRSFDAAVDFCQRARQQGALTRESCTQIVGRGGGRDDIFDDILDDVLDDLYEDLFDDLYDDLFDDLHDDLLDDLMMILRRFW